MQGLMRNNYYKILSTLKLFLCFILFTGIATVIFDNRNTGLLTGFLYLSMVGLPWSTAVGLRKNSGGKWNRYLLTLPVKRCDIVKSVFLTQLSSLGMGMLLTGAVFFFSFLIHGFPFYRHVDVLLLLSSSVGVTLFMSAVFFPISYMDTKDRTEVTGTISLLIGIGMVVGIAILINSVFGKVSELQLVFFSIGIQIFAVCIYVLSYFFASRIFLRREF